MRSRQSLYLTKSPCIYDFDRQSLYYVRQSLCDDGYFNKIVFFQFDLFVSPIFTIMGYVANFKKSYSLVLPYKRIEINFWYHQYQDLPFIKKFINYLPRHLDRQKLTRLIIYVAMIKFSVRLSSDNLN